MAARKAVRKAAPKKKTVTRSVPKPSGAAKASATAKPSKRAGLRKVSEAPTRSRSPKAGKAVRAAKSPRGKPARAKAVAEPLVVAVGDWVLLRGDYDGQPSGMRIEGGSEATEGLVCSIREIGTGKLVAKTKEQPERYLLEVLNQRTFRSQFSSSRNTGGPGVQALRSPAWSKLRQVLQDSAKHRRLYSYASGGLPNDVFGSLLDGWRVVRVRAAAVELRQ